jgi:hypothetical protein
MNSTPPRPKMTNTPYTLLGGPVVRAPPPVFRAPPPINNNLMETRVLGVYNPTPGQSWIEAEKGKRKYYRKSRRANRKSRKNRRTRR